MISLIDNSSSEAAQSSEGLDASASPRSLRLISEPLRSGRPTQRANHIDPPSLPSHSSHTPHYLGAAQVAACVALIEASRSEIPGVGPQ